MKKVKLTAATDEFQMLLITTYECIYYYLCIIVRKKTLLVK